MVQTQMMTTMMTYPSWRNLRFTVPQQMMDDISGSGLFSTIGYTPGNKNLDNLALLSRVANP